MSARTSEPPPSTPASVRDMPKAYASSPPVIRERDSSMVALKCQDREPAADASSSPHDPADVIFDGLYEIEFADTSWQAAGVCAATLARALGARAVIIHAHDLVRRELRAIGVHGPHASAVLGTTEASDDDLVASAAICNEKPLTMRFDGELPRLAPVRLETIGAARSLVAVPVLAWGRCVALIEIVDADELYEARAQDAAAYVAERLAEFLSERAAA
jgi:hypothetical protein